MSRLTLLSVNVVCGFLSGCAGPAPTTGPMTPSLMWQLYDHTTKQTTEIQNGSSLSEYGANFFDVQLSAVDTGNMGEVSLSVSVSDLVCGYIEPVSNGRYVRYDYVKYPITVMPQTKDHEFSANGLPSVNMTASFNPTGQVNSEILMTLCPRTYPNTTDPSRPWGTASFSGTITITGIAKDKRSPNLASESTVTVHLTYVSPP